jgi:hypothetical protein
MILWENKVADIRIKMKGWGMKISLETSNQIKRRIPLFLLSNILPPFVPSFPHPPKRTSSCQPLHFGCKDSDLYWKPKGYTTTWYGYCTDIRTQRCFIKTRINNQWYSGFNIRLKPKPWGFTDVQGRTRST